LISHQHRCLFIHIPKTAGKSVLAGFGLPEFGRAYDGGLTHLEDPYDHKRLAEYAGADWYRDFFKFAFVRNPWDRAVSAFFYLSAGGANAQDKAFFDDHLAICGGSFAAFLEVLPALIAHKHFRPQSYWAKPAEGAAGLDFTGRYERFDEDYGQIARRLGLPPAPARVNASRRRDYRRYYDAAGKKLIKTLYAEDIETFGYRFGDGARKT